MVGMQLCKHRAGHTGGRASDGTHRQAQETEGPRLLPPSWYLTDRQSRGEGGSGQRQSGLSQLAPKFKKFGKKILVSGEEQDRPN